MGGQGGSGSGQTPLATVNAGMVARGTQATAVSQIVIQGVRFLTNVVLARLLAPEVFGVVAVALVVTMLLDQLRDMGTGAAVIQRARVDDRLLNTVFYLNIALGALLAVILFLTAAPLSAWLGNREATTVLQAFAGLTFVGSLGQIHHALLRRHMRFGEIAIANSVTAIVIAIVSIAGALLGHGYWSLVAGTIAGTVVGTVMVWIYDRWRPSWQFDMASLRSIWSFSSNLFLSNVVFYFFTQVDKVIISHALGAGPVGTYSMAQRTVSAPVNSMSTVVGEVTFPAFSRRQDDDAGLRSGFVRSSRVIALVTFPLMFGLAAVATSVVPVVFGPRWEGLVPLVWLLAPVGAIQSVTTQSAQLLLAKGRADLALRWGLVYSVVLVSLELVGVRWGVVGVAGAYAAGLLLLTLPGLAIAFRLIDLPLRAFGAAMAPHAAITAAMVAAVLAATYAVRTAHGSAHVELVAGVCVGGLTYLGLARATKLPAMHDAVAAIRSRRT